MSTLFSTFLQKYNEIAPQETDFTEVLSTIAVKPKKLYFYGKIPQNGSFCGAEMSQNRADLPAKRPPVLAIVGSRKPTAYGRKIAYELATAAARRGAVIVSGLAYGIDAAAHRATLEADGITVAVMGTPIDQVYPREHLGLAAEIVKQGGAVMSELAPGAAFHPKACFLARNRLIAGLSDVVVIPEAAERSGSLNTAAHAIEQGREVFAAPGDIDKPYSKGCNQLIRQGAMPYLEPGDVLDLLFPPERKKKRANAPQLLFGDTPAETKLLRLLATGVSEGEELIRQAELEPAVFNQTITLLEIKGRVRALGANRWMVK